MLYKRKASEEQAAKLPAAPKIDQVVKQAEAILTAKAVRRPRQVWLKYRSCCGCGCSTYDIVREVDADSPLEDGDEVDELEADDRLRT